MSKLVVLDNPFHKDIKIDPQSVEMQGAELRVVPVVLSEFLKLSVQYPIIITKNIESGQFVCAAMLGFEVGENLFWKDNRWDAIYVPLNVTRQPFFIGSEPSGPDMPDRKVLCIDMSNPVVKAGSGECLFDQQGEDSSYLKKIKDMLSELLTGEENTQEFLISMLEMDLLAPASLDITFVNNETQRVDGIYTIDEDKISALPEQTLIALHKKNYLQPIYTMINSLAQIYALIDRKNSQISKATQWFKATS